MDGEARGASAAYPEEVAGDFIGHYQLLQEIGEGGMGLVWLAEQREPVRRRFFFFSVAEAPS